jgi:conjugal transfer pilus assembly protein TraK
MRLKTIVISTALASIACVSIAKANEIPPELPFEAMDGTALSPYKEEVPPDSWVRGSNQPPITQTDETNNQVVNGNVQEPTQNQNAQPIENPETVVAVPASKTKAKPKPKKRPKVLDKAPETNSVPAQVEEQGFNIGEQSGITIKPKPGRTENVVIAKGKLNRIVTPYAEPKVLTVDNVETKIDGSVVYIATDSETPVSLFVSDTESGNAASLQMLPADMGMPVEIRIEQEMTRANGTEAASSRTDTFARQDSPYVAEIKSIMQSMGKQQIPQGFTLEEVTAEVRSLSVCHGPNLSFTAGQLLSGHDSIIVVMIAENNGSATNVFEEAYCATEDVMAVAAWPKVRLAPGDKTEVYVLMRLPEGNNGEEIRPALLY